VSCISGTTENCSMLMGQPRRIPFCQLAWSATCLESLPGSATGESGTSNLAITSPTITTPSHYAEIQKK